MLQQYVLDSPEAADVLYRTGIYLYEHASYTIVEPLWQHALAIRERLLETEHLDTAQSLNDLAFLYYNQRKYTEAEPLYLRALIVREQIFGLQHPKTVETRNCLDEVFQALHQS